MSDNIYNPHGKEIRFIDPHYKELFTIPDGGRIVVTRPMGEMYPGVQEQWVGTCKFRDEFHTEINGEMYHICQFAEIQQRIGSTYEPETEPEYVGGYRIMRRTFVGDKVFVMGHNPNTEKKWATMQGIKDTPEYSKERYWTDRSKAWTDCFLRADGERSGVPYTPAPAKNNIESRDAR